MNNEYTPVKIILSKLNALLNSKNNNANELIEQFSSLPNEQLLSLKQCLKAFGLTFDGIDDIELQHAKLKDASKYGKYLNTELYQKMYTLCQFAYAFEKNGIPEEQAAKLATVFDNEERAFRFLSQFSQQATSDKVIHDACLFTIPDFSQPGINDEKQGCHFDVWKKIANLKNVDNMLAKSFLDMLPLAWEIENVVREKGAEARAQKFKASEGKVVKVKSEISELNKEFLKLDKHKTQLNENEENRYHDLSRLLSEKKRELVELRKGKFPSQLALDELEAFYEYYLYNSSAEYQIFLKAGIPRVYYNEFKKLIRQDDNKKIPNIKIDGKELGHEGFYLMKVPVMNDAYAARAACLGKYTDCCQSLSGEAGHACVIHGLTSPEAGFYIVCKGDVNNPDVNDPIVGQSWAWRSKNEAIVFDSIEASSDEDCDDVVKSFYESLGDKLVAANHTDMVLCGGDSGISSKVGYDNMLNVREQFKDYAGYNDSQRQQRVIFDTRQPYYLYDKHEWCTQKTIELVENAFKDTLTPFSKNAPFSLTVNYAILNNQDLFNKVLSIAKTHNREADFKQFVDNMNTLIGGDQPLPSNLIQQIDEGTLFVDTRDSDGLTPLFRALEDNNEELVKALLQRGANVNIMTATHISLIAYACKVSEDMALLLVNHGANFSLFYDIDQSPLWTAICDHKTKLLEAVIESGADLNLIDDDNYSALHLALIENNSEACLLLIQHGINLYEGFPTSGSTDDSGYSLDCRNALEIATDNQMGEVCIALIEKGYPIDLENQKLIMKLMDFGNRTIDRAINRQSIVNSLKGSMLESLKQLETIKSPDSETANARKMMSFTVKEKGKDKPALETLIESTQKASNPSELVKVLSVVKQYYPMLYQGINQNHVKAAHEVIDRDKQFAAQAKAAKPSL